VKLIFIDKSTMNLGPGSQVVINSFPKNEAGIISLVKGQIRSQVTKDYMEMKSHETSKLYIKLALRPLGFAGQIFKLITIQPI